MQKIINRLVSRLTAIAFLFMAVFMGLAVAQAQTYYLGVLAPQGESAAQQRWQPWLDELNGRLADDIIVLVPLALENWQQQIEAQKFAFVLGPQVQFIKMDTTGWRWLATLQTSQSRAEPSKSQLSTAPLAESDQSMRLTDFRSTQNQPAQSATVTLVDELNKFNQLNEPSAMEQVASALWVSSDSGIHQLQDLQRRKVVAVDKDAFGGYLLIAHLLQQNGIAPSSYQTQFVGYPIERTLITLASGAVDAAIAPLCLMEEMARQGKIDKSHYRLIHPVKTMSTCQSSTKIYPNWTLAATTQTPARLISQVNQHLFTVRPQTDPANMDGNTDINATNNTHINANKNSGAAQLSWLPPESGADAERVLYDMNQHPSQKKLGVHILDWIYAHRLWVGVIAFIIIISTINYGWMSWLAWRRRRQILEQNRLIRDYDHRLKQSERFAVIGEMSGSIAHEINQPLATIQNYAQGLLIRSQSVSTATSDNQQYLVEKKTVENALQQIVNETTRVAAVIRNIRHWASKPQSEEMSVNIADTYQHCLLLLGEKAADISFWYASAYQQLQLPSLLLDQLLINTMLNAQQQGARHIMLRCQAVDYDNKRWLALHITDDAGGFDKARLAANQLASQNPVQPHSTKTEGLGLGLMICQRLCKSLNGTISLNNVDVQHELLLIKALDGHYQQRLRRTLSGKIQLSQTDSSYPWVNTTGAQVSFYLPMSLASTSANIKGSDTHKIDSSNQTGQQEQGEV